MSSDNGTNSVRVYLCECGPLIKDALDLDELQRRIEGFSSVEKVRRHPLLCSEDGRKWMEEDLFAGGPQRVVVAGCTPKEHEGTFKKVCKAAGTNPYLLSIANIREQCAWVTSREDALDKAEGILRASIARTTKLAPLDEKAVPCNQDALIIGAGIAGLTAARLLADAGRNVVLVEKTGALGGRTALLGDVFPGFECASCMLQPIVDEVMHHPNVETLTLSRLHELVGYFGNFTAKILKKSRHVDPQACYGCKTCQAACPVSAPSEANENLSNQAAIHLPYEGALPNISLVDESTCLRFNGRECDACVAACPFGAIDLDGENEILERQVGAVIVATGASQDAVETAAEDGNGRIIGAMALERLMNSAGPTGGALKIGDLEPKSIALIHCSDEAGFGPQEVCSKICCMSFAKYAHQIREILPDCTIHEIAWERCAGGKGYKAFVDRGEQVEGLKMIHMSPADRVEGIFEQDDCVVVTYRRERQEQDLEVDLVVVSPPLKGSKDARDLARKMNIETDSEGFFQEAHERLAPFKTMIEGIYVAGSAQGPGDIQDAAAKGAAAAGAVLSGLATGKLLELEPAVAHADPDLCSGCGTCLRTCPFKALERGDEGVIAVNELLCKGCGTCAAACPSGAVTARHFTAEQIMSEVDAQLANHKHKSENVRLGYQTKKE